jgi:hypothetical protein
MMRPRYVETDRLATVLQSHVVMFVHACRGILNAERDGARDPLRFNGHRKAPDAAACRQLASTRSARRFKIDCALPAGILNSQPWALAAISSADFLASPSPPEASSVAQ